MASQSERAAAFTALHRKGDPVVLFNVWDAGGARVVEQAGAAALATASWSVAASHGFSDGENVPLDAAIANIKRIVAVTELPVTMDLESGYGPAPETVAATARRAIEAGAVGFNLEDQIVGGEGLYSIADQSARLAAARAACKSLGVEAYINARVDLFLKAERDRHDDAMVDAALERAAAYAEAGASGFFAPGLVDERLIGRLCEAAPLPVNIIAIPGAPPIARQAELGVARVSFGPVPYRAAMAALEAQAREAFSWRG